MNHTVYHWMLSAKSRPFAVASVMPCLIVEDADNFGETLDPALNETRRAGQAFVLMKTRGVIQLLAVFDATPEGRITRRDSTAADRRTVEQALEAGRKDATR